MAENTVTFQIVHTITCTSREAAFTALSKLEEILDSTAYGVDCTEVTGEINEVTVYGDDDEELLARATAAQEAYWDAVRELESALDIELDGEDLSGYDLETLKKEFA